MRQKVQLVTTKNIVMLNSLTSFRFIAALAVFLHHVGIWSDYRIGYIGVSFFFILSGFILTYNYFDRLTELNKYELKKFYVSRLAKIYPVHFLTFLLAVPYYFFIPLKHEPILYVFQALTNLMLIHSFIPFGNVSFNGVSWSLSNELFFYSLYPLIVYFVYKKSRNYSTHLMSLSGIWICLLLLFFFIPINSFTSWLAYFFPVVRLFEFIVGIFMGYVFISKRKMQVNYSFSLFSQLEIGSILLLTFIVMLSPNIGENLRYSLIYIPFLSFIIFIFSFDKGILSKLLNKKILIYLGEMSFSFYMIHNLVLSYLFFLWKPFASQLLSIVICFLISIVLSSFMYHFYEEPVRKQLRNKLLLRKQVKKELPRHNIV